MMSHLEITRYYLENIEIGSRDYYDRIMRYYIEVTRSYLEIAGSYLDITDNKFYISYLEIIF